MNKYFIPFLFLLNGLIVCANGLTLEREPFQYDGEYRDESGLIYLNARCYNPSLLRFVQRDSYDFVNRYGYVASGNPVMNKDPSGHVIEGLEGIGLEEIGYGIRLTEEEYFNEALAIVEAVKPKVDQINSDHLMAQMLQAEENMNVQQRPLTETSSTKAEREPPRKATKTNNDAEVLDKIRQDTELRGPEFQTFSQNLDNFYIQHDRVPTYGEICEMERRACARAAINQRTQESEAAAKAMEDTFAAFEDTDFQPNLNNINWGAEDDTQPQNSQPDSKPTSSSKRPRSPENDDPF